MIADDLFADPTTEWSTDDHANALVIATALSRGALTTGERGYYVATILNHVKTCETCRTAKAGSN